MTCAEFQRVLPYIIETGGNAEEEAHLKSCPVCSDLVQDLRYIAEQAKLLVPMIDPSPRVWTGIRGALEREGLVRPPAGTGRFRPQATAVLSSRRWPAASVLPAAAALLFVAVTLIWLRNQGLRQSQPAVTATMPASAPVPTADAEDVKLLETVQQSAPDMLPTYRENLDSVNAYIRDANQVLQQNPDDAGVRDHLIRAYDQKALLYQMALARSLQ